MSESDEEIMSAVRAVSSLLELFIPVTEPIPQHDSAMTGKLYYKELMETRNKNRFLNCVRMNRETFLILLNMLQKEGGLIDGRKICAGEIVMILIHVCVGHSIRQTSERWQHSTATIHDVLYKAITAMLNCRTILFSVPHEDQEVHDRILKDPKYFPFFDNCIGALDGTHVPAVVSAEYHQVFRNRKKGITQNVLAVANFDLTFAYALCGWEGSAHDGRVFNDSILKGLPMFRGKYYLGDAGYALSRLVLTPYRGVRYHLKEWGRMGERPQNAKELFNLRHSSLRNVVERIFGVVQKRFPILVTMSSYPLDTQCHLIMCCFMLHNFIRRNQLYEDCFDKWDESKEGDVEDDSGGEVEVPEFEAGVDAATARELNLWRDGIADAMWTSYQEELLARANA